MPATAQVSVYWTKILMRRVMARQRKAEELFPRPATGPAGSKAESASVVDDVAEPSQPPSDIGSVYAVGVSYSDRPVSGSDRRWAAAVAVLRQQLHDTRSPPEVVLERRYVLTPPEMPSVQFGKDISGVVGLLAPCGAANDGTATSWFERTISDVTLWALYSTFGQGEMQGDRRNLVLLQGPFLPKLRGRFFYRRPANGIRLYVVTPDLQWSSRLIGSIAASSPSERSDGWYAWSGPYPDLGLDYPGRSFVGWFDGRPVIHVEVPASPLPPEAAVGFKNECCGDLRHLFGSGMLAECESHAPRLLPAVLAAAIDRAAESQRELYRLLQGYDNAWRRQVEHCAEDRDRRFADVLALAKQDSLLHKAARPSGRHNRGLWQDARTRFAAEMRKRGSVKSLLLEFSDD